MKEIVYYKVRVDGLAIPSEFIMNKACFEYYSDAIEYVENGWKEYTKNHFLTCCGRKVINEYRRQDMFGYKHQLTIVSDTSYAQVVMLAVDRHELRLR